MSEKVGKRTGQRSKANIDPLTERLQKQRTLRPDSWKVRPAHRPAATFVFQQQFQAQVPVIPARQEECVSAGRKIALTFTAACTKGRSVRTEQSSARARSWNAHLAWPKSAPHPVTGLIHVHFLKTAGGPIWSQPGFKPVFFSRCFQWIYLHADVCGPTNPAVRFPMSPRTSTPSSGYGCVSRTSAQTSLISSLWDQTKPLVASRISAASSTLAPLPGFRYQTS